MRKDHLLLVERRNELVECSPSLRRDYIWSRDLYTLGLRRYSVFLDKGMHYHLGFEMVENMYLSILFPSVVKVAGDV